MATIKFKNAQGQWEELSAAKLETPRNINGVPFDGTQDITIPGSGETSDYLALSNKPQINGVELDGNKVTRDLSLDILDLKYPDNPYRHVLIDEGVFVPEKIIEPSNLKVLYFTNTASSVPGVLSLEESIDTNQYSWSAIGTGLGNNVLLKSFIFDKPIGTTLINPSRWLSRMNITSSVQNINNYLYIRVYVYDTLNNKKLLPISLGVDLSQDNIIFEANDQTSYAVKKTDRLGIDIYIQAAVGTVITLKSRYGSSYVGLPIPLRHNEVIGLNDDPLVQHITTAEKTQGALATGNAALDTVKKVADKAQFAPNENGTILYHTTKWFTPTGTISTNGTTATITSSQFTSAMVGAKLTIYGEERIITSYISETQTTVNSAYSQNYNDISAAGWGIFSRAMSIDSNGVIIIRRNTGNILFNIIDGVNNVSVPYYQYNNYVNRANFIFTISSSNDNPYAAKDLGFKRNSAGVLEINDGNTAGVYRDLNLRNLNYYGTLNNASDERLKHDIRTVNDGLEKVCKLAECVKHFEFNNQDIYAKGQRTGFIAQLLKANGFEGHVTEREPVNEEEGALFGWTYKDEEYEELNPETQEVEIKTRRVVDVKGDMVLQVENNFSPYIYPAVAELKKQNDELRSELNLIKQKLGMA